MAEIQESIVDLAGFQSEERTLEAVRIRIDYQTPRYKFFPRPKGNDALLSPMRGTHRETTNLDPYEVRRRFEAVNCSEGAASFLSEAGRFWIWEEVLWSQFQEWQEFFKCLRLSRKTAMKKKEGKKAWLTAEGFDNQFFTVTDREFTHARFHGAELPLENLRKNELQDQKALRGLRGFALDIGQNPDDSHVALAWYSPKDGIPPEDWESASRAFQKGKSRSTERAPYLRIEARYILEAIAATIYADKAQRLKHGECKKCGRIFEIASDHGQEFCPVPETGPQSHLKTSPCKSAFIQHERRTTIGILKDLFLEGWSKGLREREIRLSWVAREIEPTKNQIAEARAKAKKQANRTARTQREGKAE